MSEEGRSGAGPEGVPTDQLARQLPVPAEVDEIVQSTYYSSAFGMAEAVRNRAQTGFSLVTLISAALAATGLTTGFAQESTGVQVVGYVAFCLWLATGALMLWAAIGEFRYRSSNRIVRDGMPGIAGDENLAERLFEPIVAERNKLNDRLQRAVVAAIVALILTAAAAGLALVDAKSQHLRNARLVLSRDASVPHSACPLHLPQVLSAALDPSQLSQRFLQLHIPAGEGAKGLTIMDVPSQDVREIVLSSH